MKFESNNIELQYRGYASTPLLWENKPILGLKQLEIPSNPNRQIRINIREQMRLGFRVERFVLSDLEQMPDTKILLNNVQIKNKKQTIGELDCIIEHKGKPIHLEIIYKLYLYDKHLGTSEIDCWIGGNRRDSLSKKLHKLKEKQLPLLYNSNTQKELDAIGIAAEVIEQRVHFRAQLYVPYKEKVEFTNLNPNCLTGFYIRPEQLKRFSTFEFFIPVKKDWLLNPQAEVEWMAYKEFKDKIDSLVIYKSYPLCWVKYPDGLMEKFFVVWWD